MGTGSTEPGVIIRTADLWKTYVMGTEDVHSVCGVSFTVRTNEYCAIMGPSGSGKSTLMNLIGCLDTPTRGQYWLDGHLVSEMEEDELADVRNRKIGFVFQTFNLLPRSTALANVELPMVYSGLDADARTERAMAVLRQVGLENRVHHLPSEMSGGQRQRVAIARALVMQPAILLADEPTGNLDSQTGVEILELFDQLHANGNTILMVTHEPDVAQHAKRVIHIRDGKVARDEINVSGQAVAR